MTQSEILDLNGAPVAPPEPTLRFTHHVSSVTGNLIPCDARPAAWDNVRRVWGNLYVAWENDGSCAAVYLGTFDPES